jgi:hypothetical protein
MGRKWDDCLVVWYKWKWKESERKERCTFIKWQKYPYIKIRDYLYVHNYYYLYNTKYNIF